MPGVACLERVPAQCLRSGWGQPLTYDLGLAIGKDGFAGALRHVVGRGALEGQFPISMNRSQTWCSSRERGVSTERYPSPNEIYLVVEVSETTLKQDERKKLLAYQDAGIA